MDSSGTSQQLQRIWDSLGPGGQQWFYLGVAAIVVVLLLYVAWKMVTAGRRPPEQPAVDLSISIESLGEMGPPPTPPVLEMFGVPVRLAAVVVAPVGTARELPPLNRMDELYDAIVPGLSRVIAAHRSQVHRWPPQLSSRGWYHLFFSQAKLPGDGGKDTCWCSVAGPVRFEKQPIMAGLVLRTAEPDTYGEETVEEEAQWHRMLQVKG